LASSRETFGAGGSVGGPPGLPTEASENAGSKNERSMEDLFQAIERVHLSVSSLRGDLSSKIEKISEEVSAVKADMVTKETFESLDARVGQLEASDTDHPQMQWMREQLAKLDPSNKCLCIKGFSSASVGSRTRCLKAFFSEKFADFEVVNIEHLHKGPQGSRTLLPMALVEFRSRDARESVLKKMQNDSLTLSDEDNSVLKTDRARSTWQLKRNANLYKAFEVISKDASAKDKDVKIEWRMEGSKKRCVKVEGEIALEQAYNDVCGVFSPTWLDSPCLVGNQGGTLSEPIFFDYSRMY